MFPRLNVSGYTVTAPITTPRPFLRTAGHDVFTRTLTGLGERSHLLRRDITFDTHVKDVVNLLTFEDLSGVVLVADSSSGAVITGVAEVVPDRIAHVVYLDAFVPEHGQSVMDLIAPERRQVLEGLKVRAMAGCFRVSPRHRGKRSYATSGAWTTKTIYARW